MARKDIRLIKLVSGESIVSYTYAANNNTLLLSNPLKIELNYIDSDYSQLVATDWLLSDKNEHVILKKHIMVSTVPDDNVINYYRSALNAKLKENKQEQSIEDNLIIFPTDRTYH